MHPAIFLPFAKNVTLPSVPAFERVAVKVTCDLNTAELLVLKEVKAAYGTTFEMDMRLINRPSTP